MEVLLPLLTAFAEFGGTYVSLFFDLSISDSVSSSLGCGGNAITFGCVFSTSGLSSFFTFLFDSTSFFCLGFVGDDDSLLSFWRFSFLLGPLEGLLEGGGHNYVWLWMIHNSLLLMKIPQCCYFGSHI